MKKNILFAVCLLAVAGVLWFALQAGRGAGDAAVVSIADGKTVTLPLNQDATYTFGAADGAKLDVTIEVQAGRARFVHSVCPDHICENTGWLQRENDQAICLPAGVVLTITAR